MSSLQKFHRRTQVSGAVAPVLGSGNSTNGYYVGLAGDGTSYMYVAPKTAQTLGSWGSYGIVRGTTSTTNGLANTNTLYSFGSAAHPTPYFCKTQSIGGYNTWYLPASSELLTLISNKMANPFGSSTDALGNYLYISSTEVSANQCYGRQSADGSYQNRSKAGNTGFVRAVRKSTI